MWLLAQYLFSETVVSFKLFKCLSFASEVFLKCTDFHPPKFNKDLFITSVYFSHDLSHKSQLHVF